MRNRRRCSKLELRSPRNIRSLSCAAPETASTLIHKVLEGCILRRVSCRCRTCRRNRPAGALEALLG
eukprot:6115656-Alexandrium_andersonii.AAC.1